MSDQTPYAPPSAAVMDRDSLVQQAVLVNSVKAGRLIRLLGWLTLVLGVLIAGAVLVLTLRMGGNRYLIALIPLTLFVVLAVGLLFVGANVKKGRPWARIVGGLLGVLSLLNFPIGTLIGAFILYYLVRGWHEGNPAPAQPE